MKDSYSTSINLKHHQGPALIGYNTGNFEEIKKRPNNIPKGKSKLKYKEFDFLNTELTAKLKKYFSNTEIAVIFKMINRCEFASNSLAPINNDTSIRSLSKEFNISVNTVPKVFDKLFSFGVYLSLKVSETTGEKEYWVLNPNIFWKGSLTNDSIFYHFRNCDITKLLN